MGIKTGTLLIVFITIVFSIVFYTEQVRASYVTKEVEGKIIKEIRFKGLNRTEPSVVKRELLISEGDEYSIHNFSESMIRLKNLGIFSKVEPSFHETEKADEIILEIQFQEKWTIIPIMRFGGGGGVNYYYIGAYDINVSGKYYELGAQYENFGGQDMGVVWYRNPRMFNKRQRLGVDIWSIMNNRNIYDPSGGMAGAYTYDSKKINLFFDKEIKYWLILGAGLETNDDSYSGMGLGSSEKTTNNNTGYVFPEDAKTNFVYTYANIGRLNYENYILYGSQMSVKADQCGKFSGSENKFYRIQAEEKYFLKLPMHSNFGTRFSIGTTNTDQQQYYYYIGGLDGVRGYSDGFFQGRSFWFANLEYRIPSLRNELLVLQHNIFFDIGNTDNDVSGLFGSQNNNFYSAGIGIRLISPRIYRLIIRIDYAFGFGRGEKMNDISFGVQQFF